MPEFLRNFQFTPQNVLKVAIVGILVLFGLSILLSIFGGSVRMTPGKVGMGGGMPGFSMPGMPSPMYDSDESYYGEGASASYDGVAQTLSFRNAVGIEPAPPMYPPVSGGTTGNTAEQFEVTDYSATIETRDKEESCLAISKLKELEDVIFESANEHDRGCDYTFKATHARVPDVLDLLNDLNPKELSESTYTIKNQVDDFTSEEEILAKKRTSIDETMKSALGAYDDITRLATASQNADALAKIIDSKVQLIERLTQERININAQLDRLARAKAEQLDKLEYTYFHVSVYENKFVDGENLKDSWKETIRQFFFTVNRAIQDMTVNLVALLFLAVQYIVYIIFAVYIAKYLWKAVRNIWER